MTIDLIVQACIFILGGLAIFLVAKKNKWGFVCGLASQPFFVYSAYTNQQWGILAVSFIYTFSWAYGIYIWFFKKDTN